jgi:hypothetical protein
MLRAVFFDVDIQREFSNDLSKPADAIMKMKFNEYLSEVKIQ